MEQQPKILQKIFTELEHLNSGIGSVADVTKVFEKNVASMLKVPDFEAMRYPAESTITEIVSGIRSELRETNHLLGVLCAYFVEGQSND